MSVKILKQDNFCININYLLISDNKKKKLDNKFIVNMIWDVFVNNKLQNQTNHLLQINMK